MILQSKHRGFSLVEITISLGIISFAFVAVFGMLPVALTTASDSVDRTRAAQIVQRLVSEVQQTPFDNIPNLHGTKYWFDGEGEALSSAGAQSRSGPAGFVYSSVIEVKSGPSGAAFTGQRTRNIVVKVAKNREVASLPAGQEPMVEAPYIVGDVKL